MVHPIQQIHLLPPHPLHPHLHQAVAQLPVIPMCPATKNTLVTPPMAATVKTVLIVSAVPAASIQMLSAEVRQVLLVAFSQHRRVRNVAVRDIGVIKQKRKQHIPIA